MLILTTTIHLLMSLDIFADIVIDSNVNKAKVFSESSAGARQLLGETPLKLETLSSGVLLVEKEGHVPVQVLVAPGIDNLELTIQLKALNDWSPEYMRLEAGKMADKAIDRIIKAQALLDERKTAMARPLIDALMYDYPSSFAVKILHANHLALTGNALQALEIYTTISKDLGPSDTELKTLVNRMIEGLQKIVSRKRSAT
jgi:hypothetical protein